jgi:hypothetical protein
VHAKGQGTGPKDEVGSVLYMRGLISAMLGVEGVRKAQERYGKGKVMTGEQVRWGLENLNLDQKTLDAMGFAGVMRPVQTSCLDHMGSSWVRVQYLERQQVGGQQRLVPGRREVAARHGDQRFAQVRRGEEDHAAYARAVQDVMQTRPPRVDSRSGAGVASRKQARHEQPTTSSSTSIASR